MPNDVSQVSPLKDGYDGYPLPLFNLAQHESVGHHKFADFLKKYLISFYKIVKTYDSRLILLFTHEIDNRSSRTFYFCSKSGYGN